MTDNTGPITWGPGWWEPYETGTGLDPDAAATAARALAVLQGDGRAHDADPDARAGFLELAHVVIGVYLAAVNEMPSGRGPDCAHTVLRDGAETVYRCDLPPGHEGAHQQSGGPMWDDNRVML